jgi:hypothetical protein
VNDVTPPVLRLRTRVVERGDPVLVTATDAGSGIYPASIRARIGLASVATVVRRNVVRISTASFVPGRYRLRLSVSDYQETKNTENVAGILPNTRVLTATVTIRP